MTFEIGISSRPVSHVSRNLVMCNSRWSGSLLITV